MFGSSSARLAALFTIGFAAGVVLLGLVTFLTTRAALVGQFEQRIQTEAAALAREYRVEGLIGVAQAVRERDHTPGELDYGLEGPGGAALAGHLARAKSHAGWSTIRVGEGGEMPEKIRVYTVDLGQGYRVLVGDDDERIEQVERELVVLFTLAFLGVLGLGAAGGYGLSRVARRRLSAIADTAEAIIDGDLGRRVPKQGSGDDLDRLAATLNRMLDRIEALMESLRQVSNDIAHDLRTPLTRLRQRLEEAAVSRDTADKTASMEAALDDLDAILGTFAALLRIAQIESGARRAAFRHTDLATTARTVVEAFAPAAEDAGARLELVSSEAAFVEGDPELLTQMLVNLVENALRHGGPGVTVTIKVDGDAAGAVLTVTDTGPGVPEFERERLFDRFYRLEHSRSTPGSGLGLALVAAVAHLHGAEAGVRNLEPGFEVRVAFQPVSRPRSG
ncbi:MAG: sensor histidine kinase [Caulobacteraceae bacterium]